MRIQKRFLICNADDFGFSKPITDAIVACHKDGIVTSTTIMANMPAAEYACQRMRGFQKLGVGVHLNLTEGRPILPPDEVPDLIDDKGFFLDSMRQCSRLWYGEKIFAQVKAEFKAQFERSIEMGVQPTHCDSHHGIQKRPIARRALISLFRCYRIPFARTHRSHFWSGDKTSFSCRLKCLFKNAYVGHRIFMRWLNHMSLRNAGIQTPDRLISSSLLFPNSRDPKTQLLKTLENLPSGISEIIFHPGYEDNEINEPVEFKNIRVVDFNLACDADVLEAIKENRIKLISFREAFNLTNLMRRDNLKRM